MFIKFQKYFNFFRYYLGNKIYITFVLTSLAGFADGLGIAVLIPLFQTLDTSKDIVQEGGYFVKSIASLLYFFNLDLNPFSLIVFVGIIFIFKGTATFFSFFIISYFKGILLKKLKIQLCKDYYGMSYKYYLRRDSGYFSSLVNEQTNNVLLSFNNFNLLISKIIQSTLYLSFAILISKELAFILAIFSIIIFFGFKKINKIVNYLSIKVAEETILVNKLIIEIVQSFKYLKATAQLEKLFSQIYKPISNLSRLEFKSGIYIGFTNSFKDVISILFILIIICIEFYVFKKPITKILISLALIYKGANSIVSIQYYWQNTLEKIGSLDVITNEHNYQKNQKDTKGKLLINDLETSIELKDLYFNFDNGAENILSGINLKIDRFSTVAFVGKSGSGKSTIINILTGLLTPTKGNIFVNKIRLSDFDSNSWNSLIGYVSQETCIFNASIANNISLDFRKNNEKNFKKIKSAAKAANISSFIESLPNGYNTFVGDRGVKLSGGQRQRLFIARELYKEPKILILDEATSALDNNSEEFIKKSIENFKGRITTIIVAHRLSTIKNADIIYVINNGTVVESGNYNFLRNKRDSYFNYLNKTNIF